MDYPKKIARVNHNQCKAERWKSLCNAYKNAHSMDEFMVKADLLGASYFERLKFQIHYVIKNEKKSSLTVCISAVAVLLCISVWFAIPAHTIIGLYLKLVASCVIACFSCWLISDGIVTFCNKMDMWISYFSKDDENDATCQIPSTYANSSLSSTISISIS